MVKVITYRWADPPSDAIRKAFDQAASTWEKVVDVDIHESVMGDRVIHIDTTYPWGAADLNGPGIWFNPSLEVYHGFRPGTYGFMVPVHEIGHSAFGLVHPHEVGSSATMLDSVMSYTYVKNRAGEFLYPETPMPEDIEAVGSVLGLNQSTVGNTTHVITEIDGRLRTEFDYAGDLDIIDLKSILSPCTIDLGHSIQTDTGILRLYGGFEGVVLGQGVDSVYAEDGEFVFGASSQDRIVTGTDWDVLSRKEKKALDLSGKWASIDDGECYVKFNGLGKRGLDDLLTD